LIGDIQAAGQGRYAVLRNSREVFLLTSVQSSILTLNAEDIYDISFIPYEELHDPEILMMYFDYIILERDDVTIELYRRTEEEMRDSDLPFGASAVRIMQPFIAESNDSMIQNTVIDKITTIMPTVVETIKPADLSIYGLDNPIRLTVNVPAAEWSGTLLIGAREIERNGRFVMIEGHDAVLLDIFGDYSFIDVSPTSLRSSIMWLENINNVDSLTFVLDGSVRELVFEHEKDDSTLRAWLDETEISETNGRRLYMAALMITQTGISDARIPANTSPEYSITMKLLSGTERTLDLYQLTETQFLIVLDGESTGFFTTRMALQQNILSRFEMLDDGRDLPMT